ncbi:MAG: glycosyltransferase [Bacteroidetes bacterium]|nr:glycosyltransferase [Bacteroidota bacterium]
MKISIITVCRNCVGTIEDTIKSILEQDYPSLEYIIIDGSSTDGTLDIIERYKDRIAIVVSEKDSGYYEGLNKGIRLSTGDVIGNLNSDDFYVDSQVISKIANLFVENNIECAYADLVFVAKEDINKIIRYWRSNTFKKGSFKKGWMPSHPTFFTRKRNFENHGYYNTVMKYSADYELMLRFLQKNELPAVHLDEVIIKMRMGGFGNVSWKAKLRANIEDRKAWKMNGLKPGIFTFIRKPLSKLHQYFNIKSKMK